METPLYWQFVLGNIEQEIERENDTRSHLKC